ncbi:hypothetical protein F511_25176 [Dorcoceras hygrometricum]|uniref:Uncharacterized protein n=1 Tax=Dorcoceras hygrometricum TaxID=472368 RepID=A0A2Z7C7X5_9LAMI|nr:hypothetical protein F511_25176 [Dorcoceras hygrometricum]
MQYAMQSYYNASGFTDLRSSISLIVIVHRLRVGIRITPPSGAAEEQKHVPGDDQYDKNNQQTMTFIGCFVEYLAGNSCLAPIGFVKKTALHGLTRSARTDSPRRIGRNEFPAKRAAAAAAAGGGYLRGGRRRLIKSRYLCDPQWFMDTASRGPTTIVDLGSQFRTCPSDHGSIGYPRMSASGESSTTMHGILHASGSHPIPTPYDPKTNQYNQDLRLIHSTNGNHLESPKEGSSIDHQVTIYLHAQNITMFPTNETWYFASQILVSNSGGYPHFDGPIDLEHVQNTQ